MEVFVQAGVVKPTRTRIAHGLTTGAPSRGASAGLESERAAASRIMCAVTAPDQPALGAAVKAIREQKNITQVALSRATGFRQSWVSAVEHGRHNPAPPASQTTRSTSSRRSSRASYSATRPNAGPHRPPPRRGLARFPDDVGLGVIGGHDHRHQRRHNGLSDVRVEVRAIHQP